jgi:PAS domain S-box-containing protein
MFHDIAEEKSERETRYRLAAIVESSDDAIISKDLNGTITSWNGGAERIFGYKADEMIGRPITLLIPPELQEDEVLILSKIRAGQRIEHFQTVRLHKNGDRLDVSLTISPVKDGNGKIIGAAKILRDVTQQKKLEAALRTSERLASVGRLAATIAHEINNPLEAVTNFIYLAKQQQDISKEGMRYLESADQELRRAAHIAQQTLGFYRDTSEAILVNISNVIEDLLALYGRKFEYKKLQIELQTEPGLRFSVWHGELKQILSNLIANALDASREHGRIIIRARTSRYPWSGSPVLHIAIADNGTGIPDQDKGKIFTPFFTTKKAVGTGLGLWVTKDLVEKRGGRIRLRSRASSPSGTVVNFSLPAVPE